MTLTAEYSSIDSENALFKKIQADYAEAFSYLHSRPQFNRRRRALFPLIERLRQRLVTPFPEQKDTFLTDSKPLPICQYARSAHSTICQETDRALPDYGYCASKQEHFYGYKLHSVHTLQGVIAYPDLTLARTHDSQFLHDIQGKLFNSLLITDKGYISEDWQQTFCTQNKVLPRGGPLYTLKRKNQACPVRFVASFDRVRRQVERTYIQLKDQFLIEHNYAKSFWGYRTRILSKATALTMIQHLNKRSAPDLNSNVLSTTSNTQFINSHNP